MSATAYDAIRQTGRLPSPTGVVIELLRLARDELSTARHIGSVVEKDPALTARLLRAANSPMFGQCRQVASVDQAVLLLGRSEMMRLALCFSLISSHRGGACRRFNYDLYWSDSLGRAVAARFLAQTLHAAHGDEWFTAGLLSQIGRLALATVYSKSYASIVSKAPPGRLDHLAALESAEYGIDHCELAAEMMRSWNFPVALTDAVRDQLSSESVTPPESAQLPRILECSGLVAAILTGAGPIQNGWTLALLNANRLGVSPDAFRSLFDQIRLQWRDTGEILSVKTRDVPSSTDLEQEAAEILAIEPHDAIPSSRQSLEPEQAHV